MLERSRFSTGEFRHHFVLFFTTGPEAKSTTVVDSVARLCQAHNTSSYEHLQQILPTQDLERSGC